MNIGIIGCGFVGLANATLLALNNKVLLWDIDAERRELISNHILPIDDGSLWEAWNAYDLNYEMCYSQEALIELSEIIILALPTDLDEESGNLNTRIIETTVKDILKQKQEVTIIIRSTVPVGFTRRLQEKFNHARFLFMPEFLREGQAYLDMVNPSRIIIGGDKELSQDILCLYLNAIVMADGNENCRLIVMHPDEAEAVKLFSNSYLAMRVAFFNEIDHFAEINGLSAKQIIDGVCEDSRIGNRYNNPSFGYGGYCLPKDVIQTAELLGKDALLVNTIHNSNEMRKRCIIEELDSLEGIIGFFRLQAKKETKNIRYSATVDILNELVQRGRNVYLYEPLITGENNYDKVTFVKSLAELASSCDVIVADRITDELMQYKHKVYSRDIDFDMY